MRVMPHVLPGNKGRLSPSTRTPAPLLASPATYQPLDLVSRYAPAVLGLSGRAPVVPGRSGAWRVWRRVLPIPYALPQRPTPLPL